LGRKVINIAPSEYDQGYMDGKRESERECMVLVAALVKRLGGRVEISDLELVDLKWHDLRWSHEGIDPLSQVTVYEVLDADIRE
jgi:hypothetical protein